MISLKLINISPLAITFSTVSDGFIIRVSFSLVHIVSLSTAAVTVWTLTLLASNVLALKRQKNFYRVSPRPCSRLMMHARLLLSCDDELLGKQVG